MTLSTIKPKTQEMVLDGTLLDHSRNQAGKMRCSVDNFFKEKVLPMSSEQTQKKLVAGAGFEPTTFRL